VCSIVGKEAVVKNDRTVISPQELDILVPSKNLAIEYCGLYWHGEISGGKNSSYHYNKMKLCNDKGIRLITIFEDEYKDSPLPVKSRIQNALGIGLERIYARKCEVREITSKESNYFLNLHHLQGKSSSCIGWGLFLRDEPVSVMTIAHAGKLKDYPQARILELKRFSSKTGVSVVGGVSKLFKQVINYAKENSYSHIKSYCDMRFANNFNSIYKVLGMELAAHTKWAPHYIKDGKRFRNKGQGYDRIFDTGHRTYLYKVK
jgi:hypothetical protein